MNTEAEYLAQIAAEVADYLPMAPGEAIDNYFDRVRQEPFNRRALIAAAVSKVDQRFEARVARRKVWIAAARLTFNPGARQACVVCGKYEGLAEAHHTLPLAVQFDAGAETPIHDFDWLCPTHHAAQHVFINDLFARVIPGLPAEESDALHQIGGKMVQLLLRLPHWERIRK